MYVLQRKIALAYLGECLFEASPLGYEVVALRDPLEDPLEASPLGRKVVHTRSTEDLRIVHEDADEASTIGLRKKISE